VLIEKKAGKMTKRNLTKGRSMKPRGLLLNPERKYKYLCEEGSAAMLMLGADGKVIDANNALLEMSGYSRDELVGKNALDFVVASNGYSHASTLLSAYNSVKRIYEKAGFYEDSQIMMKAIKHSSRIGSRDK
jgi:PAS domain S-box-containing protein